MTVLLEILCSLLGAILRVLIEVPFVWLGEVVRWAVTLGRHQPQWDCHTSERGGTFALLYEISFWIGAVTATLIGLAVKFVFFPS